MSSSQNDDDLEFNDLVPRQRSDRSRDHGNYDDDKDDDEPQGDSTGGLIPYKNPNALIAYYCGLFSLFPFLGFFLGMAGLILGIKGLKYRTAHPEVKGSVHAWIGVIMGGGMMVIWGLLIIGLVIGMIFNA